MTEVGVWAGFCAVVKRDLMLAFRRPQELANPLVFFVMAVSLFPLGVSPEKSFLAPAAAGVVWVASLLATLLSLDALFRADHEDGSLEQLTLAPQPLFILVLAKVFAHWLTTGLPLILLSPVLALMLHVDESLLGVLMLSLLVGTPVLSLIGAIGAALTVGLRVGGVLISLLVLPLYIPVLIFGTGMVQSAAAGMDYTATLAMLGAILALSLTLAPFAAAAALKISVSN
ncbi:heme exporter protein CcmB [Hahella sp. CR1]|uniref:heme exporter protein CcmB n=1 Tax=Hahella sp. CR1 TaxID=2992807 RepID=UPI002442DB6E|nr:heme exporter protein CcmB [Hahella sp. CR1]MDG9668131.1 heme exporter protein CcmB [Hahella sp. CR1]